MEPIIKFRGKHLHRHEWIYGGIGKDWNNNVFILPNENWSKGGIVEKDTIGQFIGRKDKNKTEIYDGDIITVNGDFPKLVKFIPERAAFCIANICDLNNQDQLDIWMQPPISWWEKMDIKVIGNKFDNPELCPTCATCNSYDDGKCTNFGKEVKAEDSCKYYQSDVIEYTCQQCGRKYEIIDSDAGDREKFCCKACENGY